MRLTSRSFTQLYTLAAVSVALASTPAQAGEAAASQLVFAASDTNGRLVQSDDYKGAPVLVDFGACWCGGCQEEAVALRDIAARLGPRGLQVIHVVAGDNELESIEFQKHYRLRFPSLLDPDREIERKYNRDGWAFLMVADGAGRIVYAENNLTQWAALDALLEKLTADAPRIDSTTLEGVKYTNATLKRSGETGRPRRRDRFPSIACGPAGKVYVAFTSNRNGNEDVYARVFDGKAWSDDVAVAATGADEFDGTVVVDADGRAWFSWTSNAGGAYNVYVASTNDLSTIAVPQRLTDADDDAMHGRMACGGDGSVWLVYYKWLEHEGISRDREVYVRRYDGKTWSQEAQVSPTDVPWYEDHSDARIAAVGNGAVVCWSWDFHRPAGYTKDAQDPTVFVRSIGPDLKMGKPRVLSGNDVDTMPPVAVDSEGIAWCAWEGIAWDDKARADRKGICAKAATDGAKASVLSWGARNVCTTCLAAAPGGGLTAVWAETATSDEVTLKRSDLERKTKRWGAPETLVANGDPRSPSVAFDAKGTLWVAYSAETNGGMEIVVKSFASNRKQ